MNKDEIIRRLTGIYHEVFNDNTIELSDEMTANDIEGWDSLTHLRLIMQIEKEFSIKFATSDIKKAGNVGQLIVAIEERIKI